MSAIMHADAFGLPLTGESDLTSSFNRVPEDSAECVYRCSLDSIGRLRREACWCGIPFGSGVRRGSRRKLPMTSRMDSGRFGGNFLWGAVKRRGRRPQPVDEAASLAPTTPPLRENEAGSLVHETRAGEQ